MNAEPLSTFEAAYELLMAAVEEVLSAHKAGNAEELEEALGVLGGVASTLEQQPPVHPTPRG